MYNDVSTYNDNSCCEGYNRYYTLAENHPWKKPQKILNVSACIEEKVRNM